MKQRQKADHAARGARTRQKNPEQATAYIALLRGVNIAGNALPMERVRQILARLGFENVRTYVQSGNVVFQAQGSPTGWVEKIEQALAGKARLPVSVIVRSAAELERVIAGNPFLKQKAIDRSKLHVTFLDRPAPRDAAHKLAAIDAGDDQFHAAGSEIYLHCPNGYGRTKLANNRLEKVLAARATTRNWNTVTRLAEMAAN
jgi:uncharacterized protein (DUF1697 family)